MLFNGGTITIKNDGGVLKITKITAPGYAAGDLRFYAQVPAVTGTTVDLGAAWNVLTPAGLGGVTIAFNQQFEIFVDPAGNPNDLHSVFAGSVNYLGLGASIDITLQPVAGMPTCPACANRILNLTLHNVVVRDNTTSDVLSVIAPNDIYCDLGNVAVQVERTGTSDPATFTVQTIDCTTEDVDDSDVYADVFSVDVLSAPIGKYWSVTVTS